MMHLSPPSDGSPPHSVQIMPSHFLHWMEENQVSGFLLSLLASPFNSSPWEIGCPVCRVGVLEYCFTCLGIFLAIVLFPFGFLCCFALRKRRCPNCGAVFT